MTSFMLASADGDCVLGVDHSPSDTNSHGCIRSNVAIVGEKICDTSVLDTSLTSLLQRSSQDLNLLWHWLCGYVPWCWEPCYSLRVSCLWIERYPAPNKAYWVWGHWWGLKFVKLQGDRKWSDGGQELWAFSGSTACPVWIKKDKYLKAVCHWVRKNVRDEGTERNVCNLTPAVIAKLI